MNIPLKRIAIATRNSSSPPKSKRRRTSPQDFKAASNSTAISMKSAPLGPLKHLRLLFHSRGIHLNITPAFSLLNYFIIPSDKDYSSYQEDVLSALRQRNINALRIILHEGRSLQCCNRFGESPFHMACRRSYDDVVTFLIHEGVSPKVKDDFGRTPLHDAFWTTEPNFKLVKILLTSEPSLFYISDKRGHIPIDYARKNDWDKWNGFFTENAELFSDQPNL